MDHGEKLLEHLIKRNRFTFPLFQVSSRFLLPGKKVFVVVVDHNL